MCRTLGMVTPAILPARAETSNSTSSMLTGMPAFRNSWSWYFGLSSYWFATSAKWFILLLAVLPRHIDSIVPGGSKGSSWGTVVMIGACWGVIGPSLFGFLTDRVHSKIASRVRMIYLSAATTCIAFGVLYLSQTVPMVIAGYLLLQIADDLGQGPYQAMVPELVPEENRGRASAAYGIMTNAAQVAIALFALGIGGNVMVIYATLGVLQLVCAFLVAKTVEGATILPAALAAQKKVSFVESWLTPWKDRDFFWVWFTRFLNALGFYLVLNYLQFFLQSRIFHDAAGAADQAGKLTQLMGLLIAVTGILGAVISDKLGSKRGRKKTVRVSGLIMFVALCALIVAPSTTVILAASVLFGLGYGQYLSADWALVSDILPDPATAGSQMGVWSMANVAPQIISGGVGFLIDALNRSASGTGYLVTYGIAALAFLLSTELVVKVKGST